MPSGQPCHIFLIGFGHLCPYTYLMARLPLRFEPSHSMPCRTCPTSSMVDAGALRSVCTRENSHLFTSCDLATIAQDSRHCVSSYAVILSIKLVWQGSSRMYSLGTVLRGLLRLFRKHVCFCVALPFLVRTTCLDAESALMLSHHVGCTG